MKNNRKCIKFQHLLNLFLVFAFVMGMLSLAPVDANASTVLVQDTVGESEIDPFDPTRPFLLEGGLDRFGVDRKYLQDGRPADWVGLGMDFVPPSGAPGQMPDNDPGPDWESEAAFFPRPESHQRRQSPMDLLLDLNKNQQEGVYADDFNREASLNSESPYFGVNLRWNYVFGDNWTIGSTVTLTIDDPDIPGNVNYSDVRTVEDWGDFNFWLDYFTLKPGQLISLNDGSTTKTHTVIDLAVTGFDEDANTISGTANPGVLLVSASDDANWENREPVANSSGFWTTSFDSVIVASGMSAFLSQPDSDGDFTETYWSVPNPYFRVQPQYDEIFGYDWTPNTPITLTIGENEWTELSDSNGWVYIYISPFDIHSGQILSVTDGTYTRTHVVTDLIVTDIDHDSDTISGTADAQSEVIVHGWDKFDNWEEDIVYADTNRNWSASFNEVNVTTGSAGYAIQYDEQGNSTNIYWRVPNPIISVYPINDQVSGNDWTPNTIITLTIGSNKWTNLSDDWGWVYFSNLPIELLPGQLVEMTDGTYTRSHTILNLAVTEVDQNADSIRGTAVSGSEIFVDGWDEITWEEVLTVADAQGNWSATFSSFNITTGANGYAKQYDEVGNSTNIYWYIPDPYFQVYPLGDYIYGYRWPANTTVTASIGSSVIGSGVSNKTGRVYISSELYDLQPGQVVKLTDGTHTRLHTVRNLAVTNIDQAADIVSGTADANTALSYVSARDNLGQWFYRYPSANSFGNWHADFSGLVDIKIGTFGWAVQGDEAGNQTCIRWNVPYPPNFTVYPHSYYVYGNNWTPNVPMTLTIGDNQWTETSNDWGGVDFDVFPFNVQPGQLVQMTDGTHTSTHTVTNHTVTDVNPATDTVCGTAEPGSEIEVGTWETYYYYVRSGIADASGDWCADFSGLFDITNNSSGNAVQYDEAGNATSVNWYVVDPKLTVYPDSNSVSGYQWPANTEITLTIGDARETWTKISSYWGYVYFDLEEFDIVPGQLVEMRDGTGTYTLTHTVRNITVTDVDTGADTVSGTADPVSALVACAVDYANQTYNQVCLDINTDGSGKWQADFSGSINITVGTFGFVYQLDENNNSTFVFWEVEGDFQIFLPLVTK